MITICSLSYYAPGVMPVRKELENGIEVNGEGAGWAIVLPDGGMLTDKSEKPYMAHVMLHSFMNLRAKYPEGPAAFHSRLSTGSPVSFENTHPVAVGGDPETLLFHNGDLNLPDLAEGESDTVRFAERHLPHLDLDERMHAEAIEILVAGVNNKAVILTSNPRWQEQAYVYNRSQWIVTPKGALHSNSDFLGKGRGWDEEVYAGDLYRWRILQDNQCPVCHRWHEGDLITDLVRDVHPGPVSRHLQPAYRNETARRRRVEAAR